MSEYYVRDKQFYRTKRGRCWYTCGRKVCPNALSTCWNCYYYKPRQSAEPYGWICARTGKEIKGEMDTIYCKHFYCYYKGQEFKPWQGIRAWVRHRKEQRKGRVEI